MNKEYQSENKISLAPDASLYEYAVIRYVPRIERGEFINIGLIMMCKRQRWLRSDIRINDMKIKAICPHANIDMLQQQVKLFLRRDVPEKGLPVEETYRWLTAAKSAILQTSPSHSGISITDLETTFSNLFHELVE
ncbi:DUF3037 domain-containing protein [bacterium]|nr:DUF3037 domain-containing protein [bacterium]